MNLLHRITLAALCCAPLSAGAQYDVRSLDGGYAQLSYTFAELRLLAQDPDGGDDADGIRVGGSALIHPNLFAAGALTTTGSDGANGVDTDVFELHLGYRHPLTPHVDALGMAGLVRMDRDFGGRGDDDDFGPAITGGLRAPLSSMIEVGGYLSYVQLFGDGDLALRGEGLYHLTPNFSVLAGLGLADDVREANVGVRWSFRATR